MLRQIVLDTETTGIKTQEKHRIVEFAAIELIDRKLTGRHLHFYINPERDIPEEVVEVHGITNEKVANCPVFKDVAQEILDFLRGAEILAHNADFDTKFIDYELQLANKGKLWEYVHKVTDTLFLSRSLYPQEKKHSLDALCKRFEVDNSGREFHGALLDSQLLAEVYLRMSEGKTDLDIKPIIEQTNWVRPEVQRINNAKIPTVTLSPQEIRSDLEMKIFVAEKSKNQSLADQLKAQLEAFDLNAPPVRENRKSTFSW